MVIYSSATTDVAARLLGVTEEEVAHFLVRDSRGALFDEDQGEWFMTLESIETIAPMLGIPIERIDWNRSIDGKSARSHFEVKMFDHVDEIVDDLVS